MSHVALLSVPPLFLCHKRKEKKNSIKRAPRESTWYRLGPRASNQAHAVEKLRSYGSLPIR